MVIEAARDAGMLVVLKAVALQHGHESRGRWFDRHRAQHSDLKIYDDVRDFWSNTVLTRPL